MSLHDLFLSGTYHRTCFIGQRAETIEGRPNHSFRYKDSKSGPFVCQSCFFQGFSTQGIFGGFEVNVYL